MKKKRNPQDLTLRNSRALKKLIEKMALQIFRLRSDLNALKTEVRRRAGKL